ncbi:MAG: para-nitroBenzyl esterase (pnb carboxy-esterase)(intracellular esterase b) (pnbce) [Acidobacteria bacterium]|nr:para-nitroBenzyl esterase (pnb carboxy-esterase)(intracellular esterase b) (pnbce) [Acidobacteriota bacterium]
MRKFIILFSLLTGILALSLRAELSAAAGLGIVKTKFGSVWGVSGQDYKTVTIFKGIPYAAPPVGELRWKPPQDPKPWDGIRVCDTYANAAWMGSYFQEMLAKPGTTYWQFYATGVPPMSEDCLYLNVTTPAVTGNEKLPIMIWFHGGGFSHGWSYEVEFNPEGLANKGVIVVSVGTRLNIFGFLSLPQLSAESTYKGSGNYGLMDCSKAVQWVHDNIQGFGGDPDNITVFGQSGGSGKTTGVLISPLSRKLIKNTINQSALGAFGKYKTQKEVETAGVEWLKSKGFSENISAAELRKIDARILIAGDFDPRGGAFSPCIDGYTLLENPFDFYLGKGNLEGKNMMFGNVFGEATPFKATTAKDLYAELKTKYGELFDKYKMNEALQLTDANAAYYRYALASDDSLMNSRIYAEVNAKLNKTCKTFVYTFGHVTPGADWGWHSSELWYTFVSLRKGIDYQPRWTFFDDLTAEVLSSYWSNYAKKGDPNDYGLSRWPQGGNLGYMFLDGMSYSKGEPLSPWEKLLREFYIQKNGLEKILQ